MMFRLASLARVSRSTSALPAFRVSHQNFRVASYRSFSSSPVRSSSQPKQVLDSTNFVPPHFQNNQAIPSWQRLWFRDLAICSGVVGLGALLYNSLRYPEQATPAATILEIPLPSDEFSHPFEDAPWYWKFFITTKRVAFLCLLFLPCAAVGLLAKFTEEQSIRDYWIRLLTRTFESAGCGFQKFGQWISMRPDMFPADVVRAMATLRQDVPEHSYAHTRKMIKESFGREIEEIFERFEEAPVASGTVAQVHNAVLRPEFAINGSVREVAVKVRHPSVLEETFVDIDFIFRVLNNSDVMTVPFNKENFLHGLQKQINFEWEAYSLAKFARDFRKEIQRGEVSFPTVSFDLLSPSVLVESWANGKCVSEYFSEVGDNFKAIGSKLCESAAEQKKQVAEQMFTICMKMFLRDNHLHGDLHAGNVMYHEPTHTLTVLDAGHTTSLSPQSASDFGRFMHGLCVGSTDEVVRGLLRFNEKVGTVNEGEFYADIDRSVRKWVAPDGRAHDGSPVCIGDLVGEILFKLNRHNVTLRGDVASSIMSIAVSEGLIRQLDPDFDMNTRALPFLAKYGFPGMRPSFA